jgi:hypothetical protein
MSLLKEYEGAVVGVVAVIGGGAIEDLLWANAFSLPGELVSLALT